MSNQKPTLTAAALTKRSLRAKLGVVLSSGALAVSALLVASPPAAAQTVTVATAGQCTFTSTRFNLGVHAARGTCTQVRAQVRAVVNVTIEPGPITGWGANVTANSPRSSLQITQRQVQARLNGPGGSMVQSSWVNV